jgi:hypothetical protein
MIPRLLRGLQDPSDDPIFSVSGDAIYASFIPSDGNGGAMPISPPTSFPGTGATTTTTQDVPGSTVAVTSGGITINLLFNAAAMAAPASFRAGIQQAANILGAAIFDQITVNIKIDYSGTGGGAAAGPDHGLFESYSTIRADLINNATPGDTSFNALASGSSIQGYSNVAVWNAQLKLWGFLGANDTTTDDGSATFATDINSNLLVGVALHELTHAMGRIPYGPQPDIFDLFRFTSPGVRLFSGGATAPAAYFSIDGGYTRLADYGRTSDASDFLNSGVQGPGDPFNEFYTSSTSQILTAVDKMQLAVLGFHTAAAPVVTTVIEAFGSTKLVEVGTNYFLNSISSGTGPALKSGGGAPYVAGQAGTWSPIGAEQTSTGYQVAWKAAGADQYSVWATDSNGTYLLNIIGVVSGTSGTLESLETSFLQDLNGDGVIGIPAATAVLIEAFGLTSMVGAGGNYFLNSISSGTGPELKSGGGAPYVAGQAGTWSPIGAEQTATGYEVAWKAAGADQYSAWATDNNGTYLFNIIGVVSGTSGTLESLETSFHQDLNGDGVIGIPAGAAVTIEAFGSTKLVEAGSNYFLNSISSGTGPELKSGGGPYTAGDAGIWSPIGAEQTSTGYQIAWKAAGADQYSAWSTDSNGTYLSNIIGVVSGTSAALETLENGFHQDLNRDGVIGIPGTIEAVGSTSLVQVGGNYFLDSSSTGTGPQLKSAGGVPYATGDAGIWSPIGAEQTSTGYQVAWKAAGADQYSVWATDSNGTQIGNIIGVVSGTNATLQSLEPSFHQDLNGDGVIGVPAAASPGGANLSSTQTQGSGGNSARDVAHFRSGQDSSGWHFASSYPSGSGSISEPEGSVPGMADNKLLTALMSDAQVGQTFQPADGGLPGGHDDMTVASAVFPDLHAGYFIH